MPPCLPWLPCGLHKFCLKYFLKSFATHTLAHIRTHSRPLAVGTCTTCCVLSSLCVCSSWSSLTALSLCALTQFVLTFAQLTHPLEWRQAAAAAALSAWLILTTRMATLSSAYDAYAAWLAAKCLAQLFNNLANSHHSHLPPRPRRLPRCPFWATRYDRKVF